MGNRITPWGSNSFWLEMGREQVASFQEVTGLEDETEVRELQQSGQKGQVIIIKTQGASPLKAGTVTAKYAAFKDDPIRKWRDQVIAGKTEDAKKDISIVIYDIENAEVARFNFANAWPFKLAYSSLSSKSNEPITVTVSIAHEGMRVAGYNDA